MDDGLRTPTRSEIDTFKVLANPEFASIRKNEPAGYLLRDQRNEIFDTPLDFKQELDMPEAPETKEAEPEFVEGLKDQDDVADYVEAEHPPAQKLEEVSETNAEEHGHEAYVNSPTPPRQEESKAPALSKEESEKLKAQLKNEIDIEKEALLYEIEMLEKQGLLKLQRRLSMEDSLDAIQYQYDRANMIISTQQTVDWSKNGIKMGSTMLETLARRFGITYIDGFSNNLCKDMNKFNAPLTKMVRKYWRRGTSSPEMELGMIVFSSLAMTVMQNKGLGGSKETKEPSTAKAPSAQPGPSLPGPAVAPTGVFGEPKKMPSVIPEWAKSAMNAPLPKHFAAPEKPVDTFPELARNVPAPIYPVLQKPTELEANPRPYMPEPLRPESRPEMRPEPVKAETETPRSKLETASVTLDGSVKKLTLASPKSSRRKRETSLELNLDM